MHLNPRIASLLAQLNHSALPGIDLSLDRMWALLAQLGHPQHALPPTIHVAGTNGKGSTIAFMRAMLEADGHRVHVYTSPSLVCFNERIRLAGTLIDDAMLEALLEQVYNATQHAPVTHFEAITALAFLAFAQFPADYLLLEVGMGGRLDATNVVIPIASVITPIDLDHQEFLGPDLAHIAAEKAGIIKPTVPVFSSPQDPQALAVIAHHAAFCHAQLQVVPVPDTLMVPLPGAHQRGNAALAIATLQQVAAISDRAIRNGLQSVQWPARLQYITRGPLVEIMGPFWLDGGHNAHASRALAAWAAQQPSPVAVMVGLLARKDAAAFFAPWVSGMHPFATITIPHTPDAQDAQTLAFQAQALGLQAFAANTLSEAAHALKRYQPATVLVAGSLVFAAEILKTHE